MSGDEQGKSVAAERFEKILESLFKKVRSRTIRIEEPKMYYFPFLFSNPVDSSNN